MSDVKFKADLGNGYFLNPILNGDYPDPSVICDGDDYYMTHSTGEQAPDLLVWHSKDLVSWRPICFALKRYKGYIMAPELIKYKDKYYIYCTENRTQFVVTADRPEGPWSEPIELDLHSPFPSIDPGHIATPEGERYLYYAGGIVVPLSDDELKITGPPRKVYDGWQYDASYNVEGFFLESPKLFYRNGYYYLVCAQGGTGGPATAHMAVVARAKSPLGPWENSPYNPLVHTFSRDEKWWIKGHGTIFEAADKSWWVIYHAYEKGYLTHGRKVLLEPIEWIDDGWPRIPEGISPDKPIKKPSGESVEIPSLSDDFHGDELGFQWLFFREYDPERFELNGKCLKLAGRGTSPGECHPMTCMTGDYAYEFSAKITFHGDVTAGLILFYSPKAYCGIGLGSDDEGIQLYKHSKRYLKGYLKIPYDKETIYLKLVNDHHDIIPYFSQDGAKWNKIDFCFETSGYHHNAFEGNYSLRPGIFAYGEGHACIEDFIYKGLD